MGMPITIDIPNCDNIEIFNEVYAEFERIDNSYSNYKPNSEVSMFTRGGITRTKLSRELKAIINACSQAEKATSGYFSAWAGGSFDANGYIKGWAISRAGELIEKLGYKTYCIGAGGDILARGNKTWKIAIQDPFEKQKIVKIVNLKNQSIATSGNYEKGFHIVNPKTKKTVNYWASTSVVGPDIIKADILATACFAMGKKARRFMEGVAGYSLVTVSKAGKVLGDFSD